MWTCPICKNRNADTLTMCWMCGALPSDKEEPTMLTVEDLLSADRPSRNLPKPVSVTRRFSVGTMMILMTFFAVVYSLLKLLGAGPPIFAGVTVYFLGIGGAQMICFGHASARIVSVVSGIAMGFISGFTALAVSTIFPPEGRIEYDSAGIFCLLFCFFGGPFGYLAGGLIAGIFLFREHEEQAAEGEDDDTK